jgi:hypothetical protein
MCDHGTINTKGRDRKKSEYWFMVGTSVIATRGALRMLLKATSRCCQR